MTGLGNANDVYKHYLQLVEENKQLRKSLSEIKDAYIDLTTQDEYGSYYIDEAKIFIDVVGKIINSQQYKER